MYGLGIMFPPPSITVEMTLGETFNISAHFANKCKHNLPTPSPLEA